VFKKLQGCDAAHIAAVAKRALNAAPAADGVYIPCNQWSGADAAPLIEQECGVPVVTGAHADYWKLSVRSASTTDRRAWSADGEPEQRCTRGRARG